IRRIARDDLVAREPLLHAFGVLVSGGEAERFAEASLSRRERVVDRERAREIAGEHAGGELDLFEPVGIAAELAKPRELHVRARVVAEIALGVEALEIGAIDRAAARSRARARAALPTTRANLARPCRSPRAAARFVCCRACRRSDRSRARRGSPSPASLASPAPSRRSRARRSSRASAPRRARRRRRASPPPRARARPENLPSPA